VYRPRLFELNKLVKFSLGLRPAGEPAVPRSAEDVIAVAAFNFGHDCQRGIGERHNMFLPVLCPLARQCDRTGFKVNLGPFEGADLVAATAGQKDELNDATVIVVRRGKPNCGGFRVRQ